MTFLWIILSIAGIAVDIATSSILFVSFTLGSVVALISQINGVSIATQIILFISVSIVSLSLVYPLITKRLKKTIPVTLPMEKSYIGRTIKVDKDIIDKASIKLDGIYWTVVPSTTPILKGHTAVICGIKGNKLILKNLKED